MFAGSGRLKGLERPAEQRPRMGKGRSLAVTGYDPDRGVFIGRSLSSFGEVEDAAGKFGGDTFTWTGTEHRDGKKMQGRFSMKILSARTQ